YLRNHPGTPAELAKNLDYRVEIVKPWCETMWACGYLNKKDETYSLTRWSKNFLWKESPTYLGFIIQSIETLYLPFLSFNNKFKKAEPFLPYSSQHMIDVATVIVPIAKFVVPVLFNEIPLLKMNLFVLDVGCGLGYYLITLAERNPQLRGLGIDKESFLIQRAGEIARSRGLQDRIRFLQMDLLEFVFSEEVDCILISSVLQTFSMEINIQLLSQLSSNLKDSGYLIILECLIDESRVSPKYGILFNMYLRMESLNARTYTLSEIKLMLEKSSFRFLSHKSIITGLDIIIAQPRKALDEK
ncbi:MAG: class I SAM-dependent methyltransferase, partial [Candidatus Helarchaeota archaeon]